MPDFPYSVRMSTTSGPVVPESTGKSSDVPSGNFSVAFLSAMALPLCGAQARDQMSQVGRKAFAASDDDVPQIVVGQIEDLGQLGVVRMPNEIAAEHDVQLEKPAPAFPPELFALDAIHQTARLTSSSLMWLIALVGFRFFGQTSAQFMIVWQRKRRYGSSRLSRRSLVAWSRVSAMKR